MRLSAAMTSKDHALSNHQPGLRLSSESKTVQEAQEEELVDEIDVETVEEH